jgi:hypothetical protein
VAATNLFLATPGDHTAAEAAFYWREDDGVEVPCGALLTRGKSAMMPVIEGLAAESDAFEGSAVLLKADVAEPQPGDRLRTATDEWTVRGINADLPGAWIVKLAYKRLRQGND